MKGINMNCRLFLSICAVLLAFSGYSVCMEISGRTPDQRHQSVQRVQGLIDGLRAEVGALKTQLDQKGSEIEANKQRLDSLTARNEAIVKRAEQLEKVNQESQQKNTGLQTQLEGLKSAHQKELAHERERSGQEVERVRAEIAALMEKQQAAEQAGNERSVALEQRNAALAAELEKAKSQVGAGHESKERIELLQEENKVLREQVAAQERASKEGTDEQRRQITQELEARYAQYLTQLMGSLNMRTEGQNFQDLLGSLRTEFGKFENALRGAQKRTGERLDFDKEMFKYEMDKIQHASRGRLMTGLADKLDSKAKAQYESERLAERIKRLEEENGVRGRYLTVLPVAEIEIAKATLEKDLRDLDAEINRARELPQTRSTEALIRNLNAAKDKLEAEIAHIEQVLQEKRQGASEAPQAAARAAAVLKARMQSGQRTPSPK